MAKKAVGTKGYVKVKKRKKRRLVKYLIAYAAIRTTVKTAGKLIDKYNEGPEIAEDSDVLNYSVAFNGKEVKLDHEPFNGATINTICSGLKLDLSNAIIEDDVNIFCKSTLSGISLIVPENVKVDISSDSKLSAVANNVPGINDDTVPTIHIHSENLLSGIDVKVKKASVFKTKTSNEDTEPETIDIE
jgi:predicted membrane protein